MQRSMRGLCFSPRSEDAVGGCRGHAGARCFEQLAAKQPADGGLSRAAGDADGFGEVLIADLNGGIATLLLRRDPEIDEECDGAFVMPDEVPHENVRYVIVELSHGQMTDYINCHYSNIYPIAIA
jgi:hypothetical protein